MQDRDSVRTHWRRRVRWARVFIVGMVCGGVQIFLLLATGVELKPWLAGLPLQWPLLVVGALSACSYLVFAFLEGYLAASRKGMIAAGSAAGRVVGGISALTVAIPIVVVVVMMLATPISTAGEVDPHDFRPQIVFVTSVRDKRNAFSRDKMRFITTRQSQTGGIADEYTRPVLLGGCVLGCV